MTTNPAGSLRRENLAETPDRAQPTLLRQPWPLAAHDEVIDTKPRARARNSKEWRQVGD
jgi:hypothetical protein